MTDRDRQFSDNRAVTPVIGVILMVSITVVLASVIGGFVLGFGDQIEETAPNAQISITEIGVNTTGVQNITFAHNGGDSFTDENTEEIRVTVGGEVLNQTSNFPIMAGDEVTLIGTDVGSEGDTVRIVWVGQERSSVLAQRTA